MRIIYTILRKTKNGGFSRVSLKKMYAKTETETPKCRLKLKSPLYIGIKREIFF